MIVANEGKRATGDIDEVDKLLEEFRLVQKHLGRAESTIKSRISMLRKLVKDGADLYDPESVKKAIYNQKWVNKRKNNAVDAYKALNEILGLTWSPPRYQERESLPFLPLESELDDLIAGTGKKTSALLRLLKETAVRIGEACMLTWDDIDFASNVIRISPEKGSYPRVFRVSNRLMNVLASVKAVNQVKDPNRVFAKIPKSCRRVYSLQRDRIAEKLQNPRIKKITFHTFRHWKGTMVYHDTKDVLHTKRFLGHKSLNNTLKYIQLDEAYFKEISEEYITKVARTVEEAIPLVESGFVEASDFNGEKIFKKPKSSLG